MSISFKELKSTDRPFFTANEEVVELLESMTAPELALAVPYIKIWKINPDTGAPANPDPNDTKRPKAPVSLKFIEPARFGASADVRFRERPPASLEHLSVKTYSYRGAITTREIQLSFKIHRPDIIFGEKENGVDDLSDMLLAGNMFVIEYGWASSGKHPLLNGEGYNQNNGSTNVTIPGRKQIVVNVDKYTFSITADLQFNINVHGIESGDLHLRAAPLASIRLKDEKQVALDAKQQGKKLSPRRLHMTDKDAIAEGIYKDLQNRLNSLKDSNKLRTFPKIGIMVTFKDFVNKFFAPVLEEAFTSVGYKEINLWVGTFNDRAGKTVKLYGSQDVSNGRNINEFLLPLSWIQEKFSDMIKKATEVSVVNFISIFTRFFAADEIWDRTDSKKDALSLDNYTIPDVRVKTIANGTKVDFYIVDIQNEVAQFVEDDRQKGDEKLTADQLRDKLKKKNVPYVQLMKAQSFIKEADFNVNIDDQIRSILIKRYNEQSRDELTGQPTLTRKKGSPPPEQLIYASAIDGEIKMIGNFAFDMFAMIWLEFGVRSWDGTFYVMEHEDTVDRAGFTTQIHVRSTGMDPLNTQGRHNLNQKLKDEEQAPPPPGKNKKTTRSGSKINSKQ